LRTSNNEEVTVANVGQYLELAGPDFNAQIRIDNQMWAGNVEIHLKSSVGMFIIMKEMRHTKT
jgi:hypothetical protein